MLGFFSGVVLALWFRNEGPQQPVYEWLDEETTEELADDGDEEAGKKGGSSVAKAIEDEGTER
jgi:hypothetical protein